MNHADAFLAEILAAHDDAPRLIFADWLEERGDPRGEFIRVQCELGRIADKIGRTRHTPQEWDAYPVLQRRERELLGNLVNFWRWTKKPFGEIMLKMNRAATTLWDLDTRWVGGPPDHHADYPIGIRFRRGFVDEVHCPADAWLAHADAITKAAPVREVTLTTRLDWFHDGDVIVLHDGRHPRTGPTWYRCKNAKMLRETGVLETLSRILAAEWDGITFRLPPNIRMVGVGPAQVSWEGRYLGLAIEVVSDEIIRSLGIPARMFDSDQQDAIAYVAAHPPSLAHQRLYSQTPPRIIDDPPH